MTHATSYANNQLKPTKLGAYKIYTLAAMLCVWACSALASEVAEEKPAVVASPTYTVPQSTPVDKVVQTVYANSPLNIAVLRKVLVDANPKVITGNPQQRVKAGTTIVVPDHGLVIKNILMPNMAAAAETPEPGSSVRDQPARRQWVRFP